MTLRGPTKEDDMRAVGVTPRAADVERDLGAGGERSSTTSSCVASQPHQGGGVSRSGRRRPPRVTRTHGFDPRDRVLAEQLAELIAPAHGRVALAVFADNREPGSVAARREVAAMLRGQGWSLERIGAAIGRHHTTVLNLLRKD